jgi:hypothetical protein
VSIISLTAIPGILIFKYWMIDFFADPSYLLAGQLLPFFLFGGPLTFLPILLY